MKNRTFTPSPMPRTRRRKGRARLFVLGAAVAASGALAPQAAAAPGQATAQSLPGRGPRADGRVVRFDISAGALDVVLEAFSRLTGLETVLALPELGRIQSAGVSGLMTPSQAMTQLLMGTAVRASFADGRAYLDVEQVREFVQVTGGTPTVSSPRYTVPLRDIAQTVTLVPRAVMEAQGASTLSEALRNVPGITLQAGEGGGSSNTAGDMFNMRGFNAANSLFVDNVRDDGLISRDVFNVEQVEVFLGPSGSDVGRGTAAGYVNMQTKTPHPGASHSVLVGYGTADQARASADFNWAVPSGEGRWAHKAAFRLNALWQDRGVPGRDLVTSESRAIAPSLALGLGTPTRVFGSAQVMTQDNVPDYGIPGAAWADDLLAPTTIRTTSPVRQANFYGSAGYDYDRGEQTVYAARVEHDVNRRLTLRNQTRYNRTHREAVISTVQNIAAFDPTTNLVTVARQGNDRRNRILSNQTTLVDRFSTGPLRHAVSAGLESAHEDQRAPTMTGLGTRAPADIFRPDPYAAVTGYAPTRTLALRAGTTSTIALYAFDTVEVNQRWQVSGGLRWERYHTTFRAADEAGETTTALSSSDALVSGRASVLFRASQAANLYVSYGTSATPPGSANFALSAQANNQNNPGVKPQASANLEVGTKWEVASGRLSLTGAAFRTANENVIFTVDATAVPPVYNQDDAQLVKGVTVGALGRVTGNWDVLANAGYLGAELRTQNPVNSGRQLTLTPKFSASLWTTYRLPRGLTLGGGIRHTDAVYVNAANTIRVPGYRIVDALVEYAVNAHLSLRMNVYNLTDEVYVRNVNNNGGRYNPGAPRSAMLTSNVRF